MPCRSGRASFFRFESKGRSARADSVPDCRSPYELSEDRGHGRSRYGKIKSRSNNRTGSALGFVVSRTLPRGGAFYYSVSTTGVYCRPSCPARRANRRTSAFTQPSPMPRRRAFARACAVSPTSPLWQSNTRRRWPRLADRSSELKKRRSWQSLLRPRVSVPITFIASSRRSRV